MVASLLASGAAVDIAMYGGVTPLRRACFEGYAEVVAALLAAGAAVDHAGDDAFTPLFLACMEGHREVVAVLLKAGVAVDNAGYDDDTPLCSACRRGHVDMAVVLLAAGAAVDHPGNAGHTPLFIACLAGHADLAALLLTAGAAVDRPVNLVTPLQIACSNDNLACVKVLSSHGASRSGADYRNAHAAAVRAGHADLSAWLTHSYYWSSPLHHLEIISACQARDLLRAGADVDDAVREGGPTPRSLAQALSVAGNATAGSPAQLVLRAAEPWSPECHDLFPAAARARAVGLLGLGVLLSRQWRFHGVEGALMDVWLEGVIPSAVDRLVSHA